MRGHVHLGTHLLALTQLAIPSWQAQDSIPFSSAQDYLNPMHTTNTQHTWTVLCVDLSCHLAWAHPGTCTGLPSQVGTGTEHQTVAFTAPPGPQDNPEPRSRLTWTVCDYRGSASGAIPGRLCGYPLYHPAYAPARSDPVHHTATR